MCVLVAQSCLILCDPLDCSLPGFSVHGIPQERTLEWVAISSSRGFSWTRDGIWVSCIAGRFFTIWAIRIHIPTVKKKVWILLEWGQGTLSSPVLGSILAASCFLHGPLCASSLASLVVRQKFFFIQLFGWSSRAPVPWGAKGWVEGGSGTLSLGRGFPAQTHRRTVRTRPGSLLSRAAHAWEQIVPALQSTTPQMGFFC